METILQRALLVIRHAKSAWDCGATNDHARTLNRRGRRDAPRMGEQLRQRGWLPGAAWCSTAVRAVQTWHLLAAELQAAVPVTFDRALYLGGLDDVRACLGRADPGASCVAVVGHNPGWEELIERLTGQTVQLTTGNVVRLHGSGRCWSEALHGPWSPAALLRPRPPKGNRSPPLPRSPHGPLQPPSD